MKGAIVSKKSKSDGEQHLVVDSLWKGKYYEMKEENSKLSNEIDELNQETKQMKGKFLEQIGALTRSLEKSEKRVNSLQKLVSKNEMKIIELTPLVSEMKHLRNISDIAENLCDSLWSDNGGAYIGINRAILETLKKAVRS
jgi:predicted RNase H-like nuclease (RuvC/YqgF family)